MEDKLNLAVFCPSSFRDKDFLFETLDRRLDKINCISSNSAGERLPELYAAERGIPYISFPITKERCVFSSNKAILKRSNFVVIVDNGNSSNVKNLIEECDLQNKPYKIFEVESEASLTKTQKKQLSHLKSLADKYQDSEAKLEDFLEEKENKQILKQILDWKIKV